MPKVMTLGDAGVGLAQSKPKAKKAKPPTPESQMPTGCKCNLNTRTQKGMMLCPVPKTDKHRSGWSIKGSCLPNK